MINLNIYGYKILIDSSHPEIDARLKLEFDYFIQKQTTDFDLKITFEINTELSTHKYIPVNLKPTFQRSNSITYDFQNIRWNDYYGVVLSRFELLNRYAHFIGKDINKLYEVIFLFILSRSGKYLDFTGKHKIHAFSFSKNGKAVICMQPMRGGKSTLLCEILQKREVSIISDDTPLITTDGKLLPFPLRMSLEKLPTNLNLNEKDYFMLKREFYKPKYSISLKVFNRPISKLEDNFILIEAKRSSYEHPVVTRNNSFTTFCYLFKHMIIGIGLPIIFEYFWEKGISDFLIKIKIFLSRLFLAIKIAFTKECYTVYLSNNVQENAETICSLLD